MQPRSPETHCQHASVHASGMRTLESPPITMTPLLTPTAKYKTQWTTTSRTDYEFESSMDCFPRANFRPPSHSFAKHGTSDAPTGPHVRPQFRLAFLRVTGHCRRNIGLIVYGFRKSGPKKQLTRIKPSSCHVNRVSRSGLKCIRKFGLCLYRSSVIKAQKRAKDTVMQRRPDSTFSFLDHQNLLFWN